MPDDHRHDPVPGDDPQRHSSLGVHDHVHRHRPSGTPHAHPHHHRVEETSSLSVSPDAIPLVHDHGHGLSFERFTYLISPVHSIDPRVKVLGSLTLILAIVMTPPPTVIELAIIAVVLSAVCVLGRIPLGWVLRRSAMVIPFAGAIALFAPLQHSGGSLSVNGLAGAYGSGGWIAAYAILAKAWLATFTMVILSATTPVPRLLKGLRWLKVPDVMLTMLSFMYRYVTAFGSQLRSLRNALESRAPSLGRFTKLRLYGHLAGNMFVRAFERGERIHAAMLSRGFDGTLPTSAPLCFRSSDAIVAITALSASIAIVLY